MDPQIFSLNRMMDNLMSRANGPLSFRFIFQPIMAILLGIRSGIRDGKQGRPYYLWTVFKNPEDRKDLLKNGWKDISKIFFIAVILDVIFQLLVFQWFYPFETLLIAVFLACIPYALIRGPVNRIYTQYRRKKLKQVSRKANTSPPTKQSFRPIVIQGGRTDSKSSQKRSNERGSDPRSKN